MSRLDLAGRVEPQVTAGLLTRRALLVRASVAAGGAVSTGAFLGERASAMTWPPASAYGGDVPAAWFDLALDLVRTTPGFSPPVASRAFGYAGVAVFLAVAPGLSVRPSARQRLTLVARPKQPGDDQATPSPVGTAVLPRCMELDRASGTAAFFTAPAPGSPRAAGGTHAVVPNR